MAWRNKYGNCKVKTTEGLEFDSRKEYSYYLHLVQMQQQGLIKDLSCQVKYELIPKQKLDNPVEKHGRTERNLTAVTYTADFVYISLPDEKVHVIDTKSEATKTPQYIIKRKLMKYIHNIEIEEV